jgi:hypothetical protein
MLLFCLLNGSRRGLPTQDKSNRINAHRHSSMLRVGVEPTTSVFEWAKTVHASYRATAVIGLIAIDLGESYRLTQACLAPVSSLCQWRRAIIERLPFARRRHEVSRAFLRLVHLHSVIKTHKKTFSCCLFHFVLYLQQHEIDTRNRDELWTLANSTTPPRVLFDMAVDISPKVSVGHWSGLKFKFIGVRCSWC